MNNEFFFYFYNESYHDKLLLQQLTLSCGFVHELHIKSKDEISGISFQCDREDIPFYIQENSLFLDLRNLKRTTYFSLTATSVKSGETRTFEVRAFPLPSKDCLIGTYQNISKPKQKIILSFNEKGTIVLNKWFPFIKELEISDYKLDPFSWKLKLSITPRFSEDSKVHYFPDFYFDPVHEEIKGKIIMETYGDGIAESVVILENKDHTEVIFRRDKESMGQG